MRFFVDASAAFGRLIARPGAWFSVFVIFLVIPVAGTMIGMETVAPVLERQVDPVINDGVLDLSVISDAVAERTNGLFSGGMTTAVLLMLSLLVFAIGDAVLMRASLVEWGGLRETWGLAVGRAVPLLGIALLALLWIGGVTFLGHGLLGEKIDDASAALESERFANGLVIMRDVIWLLFTAVGVLAADLARARIVNGGRSGFISFGWGLWKSISSITPWLIGGLALVVDLLLVTAFTFTRPTWDPISGTSVVVALSVIMGILLVRFGVHAVYVGTLARFVERLMPESTRAAKASHL